MKGLLAPEDNDGCTIPDIHPCCLLAVGTWHNRLIGVTHNRAFDSTVAGCKAPHQMRRGEVPQVAREMVAACLSENARESDSPGSY